MTDIMLRGALNALKTKIEALAASETATAEDLAMLGTALERIAGKTTAIEVEMLGEEQRTALAAASDAASDAARQSISAAVREAEANVADQIAALNAASAVAIDEINEIAEAAAASYLTATSFFYNQL